MVSSEQSRAYTDNPVSRSSDIDLPPSTAAWIDLPVRALMCVLFVTSGLGKLAAVSATQGYMAAYGVPAILIWPAAALEVGGGILLLIGLMIRPVAVVFAGWCILTALIFHTAFHDQNQMLNFLKNLAIAGGFMLLAKNGAQVFSIDALLVRRRRI